MHLFVDLNSGSVSTLGGADFSAKKGDKFPVYVKFVENNVVRELGSSARGRIVLKKQSDFSGYPLVWAPEWRKFGRGAGTYYLFKLDFNTQQLEDQFLTLSGEIDSIKLSMEIEWRVGESKRSSSTTQFTVNNDYTRYSDREEVPLILEDFVDSPSKLPFKLEFLIWEGASVSLADLAWNMYQAAGNGATYVFLTDTSVDSYGQPRTDVYRAGVSLTEHSEAYAGLDIFSEARIAPVITLIGISSVNLNVGDVFTDAGANVTDDVDAARVILGTGSVDTATPGAYTLTYSATDAAGNVATPVTRSVIVSDVVAPVITLIGASPVSLNVGDVFADAGANVTDDVDAAKVILGAGLVNAAAPGTYTLTYSATDAAGNVATPVTRSVIVSDVVAPVIALIGTDPVNLNVGDIFTDDGANVTDDVDVAKVISGVGSVNTALPDTYTLTYSATDAAGNVATPVTRSVIVSDVVAPVIALIGTDPVNLNVGDVFADDGANVTDDVDAPSVILGTVLSPTLVFKGGYDNGYAYAYNDAVLYFGKFYYRHSNPSNPGYPPDPTVTANASWAMVTDIVNTGVAGTYVLTYAATDAAGNAATAVTRSVIVS